jgi:ubiquinone/menaquinone biosynthesis C-methylase UbiE
MVNKWRKKRSVMRRYNLTAQIYDERYCEEQEAKYKAALGGLSIKRDSAVLDVGCGTGLFFSSVSYLAEMVVGADVSRELLLLAKKRKERAENIFLVLADANSMFSILFLPSPYFRTCQNPARRLRNLSSLQNFKPVLWLQV